MIVFKNIENSEPYNIYKKYYLSAEEANENIIEAILIASVDKKKDYVDARFVNLKYIIGDEWIFFSNYNSPKANQFTSHNQISAVIFWPKTNVQIRIKAKIKRCAETFSDEHFSERSQFKNALAISSNQSMPAKSYDEVINNYNKALNSMTNKKRPDYWGGFSFTPYSFEFWEGNSSRINKRDLYEKKHNKWIHQVLQP